MLSAECSLEKITVNSVLFIAKFCENFTHALNREKILKSSTLHTNLIEDNSQVLCETEKLI